MEAAVTKATFQKYPAYKDSGTSWIGVIPAHWKTEKGKWLFIRNERPVRREDEIVTCFRDGTVTLRRNRRTDGFTNALKEHGYQGIRKGDLVIHAMDAFAGSIGVSDSDGKSTPVYSACSERFKNTVNQFYYAYFLRNLALNGVILSLAKGIRERSTDFRFSDFGELILALPPLPEQTTIANFLDEKTAKIDQAIAQKEKLIALLKERKQIVIQQAVTGKTVWSEKQQAFVPLSQSGVEGKDSGVEWIGEIPVGWEVKKMAYLTSKIGDGLHGTPEYTDNTEYYFINGNNLSSGFIAINEQTKTVSKKEYLLHKKNLIYGQTLLLSINGTIGNVAFYRGEKVILGKSAAYLNFNHDINLEFIKWFLTSDNFKKYYQLELSGSTINNFSLYSIGKTPIIYPSMKEQELIVEHLKSNCAKIDQAITLQQAQIEKLKEYKATLIDSAVTGKIKVN